MAHMYFYMKPSICEKCLPSPNICYDSLSLCKAGIFSLFGSSLNKCAFTLTSQLPTNVPQASILSKLPKSLVTGNTAICICSLAYYIYAFRS